MKRWFPQFLVLVVLGCTAALLSRRESDEAGSPAPAAGPQPVPYRVVSHDWVEAVPRTGLPVGSPAAAECAIGCKNCAIMLLTNRGML